MYQSAASPRDKDYKLPAHDRPPAGMPSVADGEFNRSIASAMSPPRVNKQSSRNAFHDLAVYGGHKGPSTDEGGSPGRNQAPSEFDGIGYPRDADDDNARGGRRNDDRERDRGSSRSRGESGKEDDKGIGRGGSRRRDERDDEYRDDDRGGSSHRGGDHDRYISEQNFLI